MSYWDSKVVLVTGGSSGLGRAIAEAFAEAGAKPAFIGLEPDAVERTVAEFQVRSWDALGVTGDITRQDDVDRLFAQTLDRFGRLDVLVNCAGRSMRGGLLDTTPGQFRDLMELNLLAMVRCTRAAVPHLLRQRGHVVNIGSLAAKTAARWMGAYAATKHAVAAFSQQLRLEVGPEGLHVLLVCPGPLARDNPRLYPLEGVGQVPDAAKKAGGGARLRLIQPEWLAGQILRACERRYPELVVPWKARVLFAISQLFPALGDKILRSQTGG